MFIDALVPIFGIPLVLSSGRRIFAGRIAFSLLTVAIVAGICIMVRSPIASWILIGAFALILRGTAHFFTHDPGKILERNLVLVLDRLILSMKAGRTLKPGLKEIARELSPVRSVLLEIADRLELGASDEGLPPSGREVLRGLRFAENGSARTVERLESWRRSARLRAEFRQKSGQVTLQIRVQAAMCILLFLPVFLWNAFAATSEAFMRCSLAGVLFAAAQFWIFWSFRRFKWTV